MKGLNMLQHWVSGPGPARLGGHCARQCGDLFADGAIWIAAVLVLATANALLGWLHLPPAQMEMMEAIHLNAVYATILVASAGTISRMVMSALDRLGHWEQAGQR